jgi:hypothetical protein
MVIAAFLAAWLVLSCLTALIVGRIIGGPRKRRRP